MRLKAQWLPTVGLAFGFLLAGWSFQGADFSVLGIRHAVAQTAASVDGFRSAQFGMTEKKAYEALEKDFGFDKEDVTRTQNSIEKTISLIITVDDIIPDSGQAIVAYIFGYETKKLIQINVVWSGDGETLASAESLVATGNILRNYFVAQGFPSEGMLTNQRLTDGSILMFRGLDENGRATVLQLTVVPGAAAEDGTAGDSKVTALTLSYIASPTAPDIYKVNQGDF